MGKLEKSYAICIVSIILVIAFPPPAHAYIDPGTGSYLFQLTIGGTLAVFIAVGSYWRRIARFLLRRDARPPVESRRPK